MKVIAKYSMHLFLPLIKAYLKNKKIFILYRFGKAIGDQLCMSAIAKEIYVQKKLNVVIFSSYPELFVNNPYVYLNIDIKKYNTLTQKIIKKLLNVSKCQYIKNFCFHNVDGREFEKFMREESLKISLIEMHTLHFHNGLNLKLSSPDFFFSYSEKLKYKELFKLPAKFAIIQPLGKITYTPNKEWGFENYQKVVNITKNDINWIQIGFKSEELLNGVIDFRGKTKNLRELAFVISKSSFTLSNEGLINHFSAAVGVKSFVVFSGFSHVEIANYNTTVPIVSEPQVKCSPCWLLESCTKEQKWCTYNISVDKVVQSVSKV